MIGNTIFLIYFFLLVYQPHIEMIQSDVVGMEQQSGKNTQNCFKHIFIFLEVNILSTQNTTALKQARRRKIRSTRIQIQEMYRETQVKKCFKFYL